MKTAHRTALAALAALALLGGRLTAGDLYDKDAAKTDDVVLPKPAEVAVARRRIRRKSPSRAWTTPSSSSSPPRSPAAGCKT